VLGAASFIYCFFSGGIIPVETKFSEVRMFKRKFFPIDFQLLAVLTAVILFFMPAIIQAGTFYSCVDSEGNETISDYPVGGKKCKPIGGFEKTESTQEKNTAPQRLDLTDTSSDEKITKVTVQGNRVLVPVTLTYGNKEVDVQLVMDTGATGTAINANVADDLYINLNQARKEKAGVAGGGVIEVSVVQLTSITIGPHTIRNRAVAVLPPESYALDYGGLLGMDVLGRFSYRLDLAKQVIVWE
jgi:predicted aspartyl protease